MNGQNIGVGSWPARRATLTPEKLALRDGTVEYTYAELAARVEAMAAGFQQVGVERGDRVAYFGPNHAELLVTLFAAGRIGAITVLINPRLATHEVDYILRDSGAVVVIYGEQVHLTVSRLDQQQLPVYLWANADVDAEMAGLLRADLDVGHSQVGLDEPCLLMYTSGTTGRPKGAVLTHGNLFFNDVNVLIETDLTSDEVCLAVAPLFHIAGLNGLALPVLLKGGTVEIMRSFDPGAALDVIQHRGVTCLFGVPAMLDAFSAHPNFSAETVETLTTVIVGGAPVPERTLRRWAEVGVGVQQGYGLTETSPAVLKLSSEDAMQHVGAAGKPQFLVDVRLKDGEILTRGPNVFHCYWNLPAETAAAFTDGWFRTGDIAERNDAGFYTLRDRSKDMFISGGENVYPSEVESALLDVPGVCEAAVIGVPHEHWGEVGQAFVVLDHGIEMNADQILAPLKHRLARYKQPKSVIVVKELPRTATGKLRKNLLRDHLAPTSGTKSES